MPIRAKLEVLSLSGYLMERAVWSAPPSTQNRFLFLFLLPVAYLNIEQIIAGIAISIHYRTVVANFNNLQTHPVCNLFSTNEINPSVNIFNNNVIQNGIIKIVKSGRFNQILLKSESLQPHYIDAGDIIYVDILPYLAQKNCCYRPERSIHQSPDLVGSRILWLGWGYLGGGLIRIQTSPGGGHLVADKFRQGGRGWRLKCYDFRETS